MVSINYNFKVKRKVYTAYRVKVKGVSAKPQAKPNRKLPDNYIDLNFYIVLYTSNSNTNSLILESTSACFLAIKVVLPISA